MKYEEIVQECKRLRDAAESAETEFMLFLRKIETDAMDALERAGVTSFERFLSVNQLCRPERYRDFCKTLERAGEDAVRDLGVEAAVVAAKKVHTEEGLSKLIETSRAFREKNGNHMSAQEAVNKVKTIEPRKAEPRVIGVMAELHQLRAEKAQWDRDRKAWAAEREELLKENDHLRRRLKMQARPDKKSKPRSRKVA